MNKLVEGMKEESAKTLTENGALTYSTSLNAVVDLFGMGGALRQLTDAKRQDLFAKAFAEDANLALKCLFYLRDIRQGQGERQTFRALLKWLAIHEPVALQRNLAFIPVYGRWDDMYALEGTDLETEVFGLMRDQIQQDIQNKAQEKPISLLAKWLKSNNTSSSESRRLGNKFSKFLNWSPREYRKILAGLRSYLKIVEQKMCAQQWSEIDYAAVPSIAMKNYAKAFSRHDCARFGEYLTKVEKGEAKMNAAAIYPYQILAEALKSEDQRATDAQWKSMPNFLEKNPHKGLVMADVSGSMAGEPILMAVSLAIYFAERNNGPFKDVFLSFSALPKLEQIKGSTLLKKYEQMVGTHWEMNTNLQSAFDLVLSTAVKHQVSQEDMPEVIYVISDMEFDIAYHGKTNYESIKDAYSRAGYKMPKLVFWNVRSSGGTMPVTARTDGTVLVSGCSPTILSKALGVNVRPEQFMLEVLGSVRYKCITA